MNRLFPIGSREGAKSGPWGSALGCLSAAVASVSIDLSFGAVRNPQLVSYQTAKA